MTALSSWLWGFKSFESEIKTALCLNIEDILQDSDHLNVPPLNKSDTEQKHIFQTVIFA